jgi:hypothetical protein
VNAYGEGLARAQRVVVVPPGRSGEFEAFDAVPNDEHAWPLVRPLQLTGMALERALGVQTGPPRPAAT